MKKILIVEDDKDFLWILRRTFEHQSFEVVFAENGKEGMIVAQTMKPDLIMVDISMPEMNGIEMIRSLKDQGALPIVIFLTNLRDENHVVQVMDVSDGKADYIVKADMSMDAILNRVKHKLEME